MQDRQKAWVLSCWMDGTISLRERGKRSKKFPSALPVYSTDTEKEAKQIQIRFCRLQYDGRFVLNEFDGEIENLAKVGEMFESFHDQMKK